ncbi:MAG: hypothetical protein JJU37_05665 [Balneolaceae bacterium]|nr:hypothetical protein [Balneolaceae bacterium]
MKINKLSQSHKGVLPVRVLQHNIFHQFESTNPTFLELSRQIIKTKGLKPGIAYHSNEYPILHEVDGHFGQTPYVNSEKKIAIHEVFLSYIYCVSYSLIVLYDEAVAKPMRNQVAESFLYKVDEEKIDKAEELFKYGISLITLFSDWDKERLPNPEYYDSQDTFYIERANSIFLFAINFILCHEFAHVEKEHIDKIKKGISKVSHIKDYEKEADDRAIDLMLLGVNDHTRSSVQVGILAGLCSMLFFKKETTNSTHPDTDDRIHSFLVKINPPPEDALWGIAGLSFKLWDNQFSKNFNWPKEIDDLKELYYHIRKQIKK